MATKNVWYAKGETIAGRKGSFEFTRVDYGEEEMVEPGETREEAFQRCKRNVLDIVVAEADEIRRQIREGR